MFSVVISNAYKVNVIVYFYKIVPQFLSIRKSKISDRMEKSLLN